VEAAIFGIISDAFSAIMIVAAFVFPEMIIGIAEASTTRPVNALSDIPSTLTFGGVFKSTYGSILWPYLGHVKWIILVTH
jgi:hypothetical protein